MAVKYHGVSRYRIDVTGTVQGVGFRPFIYRLANHYGLSGCVQNTPDGVVIEVEGDSDRIEAFCTGIIDTHPPSCIISNLRRNKVNPIGTTGFIIDASGGTGTKVLAIPPDIATCNDCLEEIMDPADRRHRYPFTNCTNCGPRYTIVREIPYDRPGTTMDRFTMCEECSSEYNDPGDRRFHAQPLACPACGPVLTLLDVAGVRVDTQDPIPLVVDLLRHGSIAAIKGLGGFHLAADATVSEVVTRLRERKKREEKPFAIMADSIATVKTFARVSPGEAELLSSAARPILLLEKRHPCPIAREVAPDNSHLGIMLPYTPLHHLLFAAYGGSALRALVMTSANVREEPIVSDDTEALERLEGIADCYLVHDRLIHQRADDSVMRVTGGKTRTIRRSRGFVPSPIILEKNVREILGCGAHLKNTVCLTRGKNAYMSQHIGDLENELASRFYVQTIEHLEGILDIRPGIIAHDLHPDYLSTRYAESRTGALRVAVQHHHAHIASCLAENGYLDPVIGIACDGTGLGDDGTIWGCELLLADTAGYQRIGHLDTFPMPGGDSAAREPWRPAFSLLGKFFPRDHRSAFFDLFPGIPVESADILGQMIENSINAPMTSSLGRLFDAISAILGISLLSTFEGQAAMALEMAMDREVTGSYPVELGEEDGQVIIGIGGLIRSVAEDTAAGMSRGEISMKFHNFVVDSLHDVALTASDRTGTRTAALSGGCFQNVYLLEKLSDKLKASGLIVLTHSRVPPNDGGISLGQVVVADSLAETDLPA